MDSLFVMLIFVLVLAIFLGFELINKVPSTLHTPLMSGANAISGITIVGALLSSGSDGGVWTTFLGTAAVFFATVNVCLLYTSPSPRDQRGSRMPSSA